MTDTPTAAHAAEAAEAVPVHWPLEHLTLAGLHWPALRPDPDAPPVLMLHGWLDNCLSFVRLAPALQTGANVYAFDLAGHGLSGHRPAGQSYLLADYVADLAELVDRHFDTPVDLVGHSLGGIVTLLFAAAFPEKVRRAVTIDSLGPICKKPAETISQIRKGIVKRLTGSGRSEGYATIELAAAARAGGLSPLSTEAAMILVPRNLQEISRSGQGSGDFRWRTDPRLRHPSLMMFTEEQAVSCLQSLETPALLVRAEQGLLRDRERWQSRLAVMTTLRETVVPGSHHCHLDGDVAPVAAAVTEFLTGAVND